MGWFAKVGTIWYYVLQRENKKKNMYKVRVSNTIFYNEKR